RLREQLAQVDQLMAQADQATMQEMNAEALSSMDDLTPDGSTPTLDSVRAKIEKRYSNALGAQELYHASGKPHPRSFGIYRRHAGEVAPRRNSCINVRKQTACFWRTGVSSGDRRRYGCN